MRASRLIGTGLVLAGALAAAGCTTIEERRGYIAEAVLVDSIQPGIDNQQSVAGTLGRPTFTSQFGQDTWYYVSSTTQRKPFVRPRIREHSVLAVRFDAAGNVIATEQSGMDQVAYISPEGDETPTLGRERSFLEDLFGNIGQVGSGAPRGGPGGP